MSGKLTATRENALTRDELAEFLTRDHKSGKPLPLARVATIRASGFPHVTPTWFVWENDKFYISLGAPRRHVANLRRNDKIGLVIDEDFRPNHGPEVGAKGVSVRGTATLSTDPQLIEHVTRAELGKMLGEDKVATLLAPAIAEGRVIVTVHPTHLLSWDFSKATD